MLLPFQLKVPVLLQHLGFETRDHDGWMTEKQHKAFSQLSIPEFSLSDPQKVLLHAWSLFACFSSGYSYTEQPLLMLLL